MHLIDDVDLVLALLWTYVDILVETAYIVDRVVGGGIQLVYVERTLMQSSLTVGAYATRLSLRGELLTIDRTG